MMKPFLIENLSYDQAKIETVKVNEGKDLYMKGIFIEGGVKNANQRVYPANEIARAVGNLNEQISKGYSVLGEVDHPTNLRINLDRVSHMITKLVPNGTDFIGRAKIMDTPYGKIVKSFIDEDVKFGVSSRGVGSLRNDSDADIVGEDFYLATAADIVADPSAPDAFVAGLREQREWVWDNGVLSPAQMERLNKQVSNASVKSAADSRRMSTKVFESFMQELKRGTKIQ